MHSQSNVFWRRCQKRKCSADFWYLNKSWQDLSKFFLLFLPFPADEEGIFLGFFLYYGLYLNFPVKLWFWLGNSHWFSFKLLQGDQLERSFAENDIVTLVNSKLNMSQEWWDTSGELCPALDSQCLKHHRGMELLVRVQWRMLQWGHSSKNDYGAV